MRVLVADDSAVVRFGMVAMLEDLDEVDEVLTACDGAVAVDVVTRQEPDLVFLDVRMPVLDGLGALAQIAGRVPVVMLTHSEEPETIRQALALGARGYLVHGTFERDELRVALRSASTGALLLGAAAVRALTGPVDVRPSGPAQEVYLQLTDREREIMEIVAEGATNLDVAQRLYLSEKTIKNHLNRMYAKLGVTTRAQAVSLWLGGSSGPWLDGAPRGAARP